MQNTSLPPLMTPSLISKSAVSKQPTWKQTLRKHWLALAIFLSSLLAVTLVIGGSSPPSIPAINLSSDPLFATAGSDKPVIALALSVEFPTVGAQYRGSSDYSNSNEYLGYYDAEGCYTYNKAPTETPGTGQTTDDFKRFDRVGPATSRMCNTNYPTAFSGNFLNWASNSAIDMLRLALTGGDRIIDTSTMTVLQRAYLPSGGTNEGGCYFNNSNYFPAKQLKKSAGTGIPNYFGAVPTSMATDAGSNNIWIANMLNKIYFRSGTSSTGSCTDQTGYTLGTPPTPTPSVLQPILYGPKAKPSGYPTSATCTNGSVCSSLTGLNQVLYGTGSGSNWVVYVAYGAVTCNATNFPGGSTSTSAACYAIPYTGTAYTAPVSTSLSNDSFFYARAQVCNVNASGVLQDVRDYGLCNKYPSGKYKPGGAIQKYSDQLRLAAFGYLMDQTASYNNGRYGGVLRAPVKYVGSKTFDTNGIDNTPSAGNPNKEWNESTGIFISNPDNNSTILNGSGTAYLSGVITYLNQFGRTGATLGRYKQYDPVGELHYEVLRYLQGLQPSPAAISSITSAMYDGFPVTTTWTDPYAGRSNTSDYSCLKSNIVVIGDVNTHDGNRLPTTDMSNNIIDINYWRGIVQSFEKNSSTSYTDGQGVSRTTGNPNTANANVPTSTTTSQLMGSAYWAHTHDIRGTSWTAQTAMQRPGLRVKTFTFDVNQNSASYDATSSTTIATTTSYRQNKNQFFMASKYGGFESDAANIGGNPYNAYGNPFKQQNGTNNNNVWQSSTSPGEAATYYLQSSARGVLSAFDNIFSRASTSARSIAGAAKSGDKLTSASSNLVYQASFNTSDWSGDVLATPISTTNGTTATLGTTSWSAATKLGNLTSPATTRDIVIGMPGATADPVATAFTWSAIGTAMQTNLSKLTTASTSDSLGEDRVNYLRGDKSNEGTTFRSRNSLLGDIINSGIVYKGAPTTSVSATTEYSTFYTNNSSRVPALFVGANDGMLHAFNANTGDELFGYIPSWMGSKLAALTSKTYVNSHQAYVDGTPVVEEAQIGSAGAASDWKTVLVSGTGAGGAGVFALDVTNPSTFSASNVMWEFTHADDADLGYVVGKPKILKLRTSTPDATTATYRWFAVFASGVNNYVTDSLFSSTYSTTGNPALFLLALDKAAGTAWSEGTNYYKISVPVESTLSATTATGLLNFLPISTGSAGELTQIYMGDLHGKLWKLDFSKHGTTEWTMDMLSPYKKGSSAPFTPYPLYTAQTAANAVQAISAAPTIVPGTTLNGVSTVLVSFVTGKYLEASDKTSTVQNSFYEILDNGSTTADSSPAGSSVISGRGRLIAGTVNTTALTITMPAFKWGRATTDADTTQRSGMYADFPTSGERGITSIQASGNNLYVNTLIPASSGAVGSCAAAGGDGVQYTIDDLTGNGPFNKSTTGLLGESLFMDLSYSYTNSKNTGRRVKTTVKQIIQTGSNGITSGSTVSIDTIAGRLNWRQINNYQDLKNK